MTGYTRADVTNNIADGNVINASDLDNEFDAIDAAFNFSTGHTHDGTSNGAPITKVGPTQDVVVSASAVTPKTTNTVDLGSALLQYKDLYIDGTANIDSLVADTADINGGTIDGTTIGGTTPAAGTFTQVNLGDSEKAIFGAGSDLQIYHNPTSSTNFIIGTASLNMSIVTGLAMQVGSTGSSLTLSGNNATLSANTQITLGAAGIVTTTGANGVSLDHSGSTKLSTTSTGIEVTGLTDTDTLSVSGAVTLSGGTANGVAYLDGSKVLTSGSALTFDGTSMTFADNSKAIFGAGSDLEIYHSGFQSYIKDTGTGALNLQSNSVNGISSNGLSLLFSATEGGAVTLFYDGNSKLSTNSTGVEIAGLTDTDTLSVSGNTTLGDASTDTVTVNGYMGVGGAANSGYGVYQTNTALTGATQNGFGSFPVGTSSATSAVRAFVAQPATAATSFTAGYTAAFYAGNAAKGAGSTITNQHGLYIADQTQGTNNYGITSLVSSGTNKWNIYASGTAANYFAGNVGIGTSSDASTRANATTGNGHVIQGSSYAVFTRESASSGQSVMVLNDTGVDGSILDLRKDGTTIGSIGVDSGSVALDGPSANVGIRMGGVAVLPRKSGADADAQTSLGTSAARFKDLYLSGGVYLGGTAAANALDDYEEGTFTPTIVGTTTAGTGMYVVRTGKYTKIGNVVYFGIYFNLTAHTGTGDMVVTGLPFTAYAGTTDSGLAVFGRVNGILTVPANSIPIARVDVSATTITLYSRSTTGTITDAALAMDGSTAFSLYGFYYV